MLILFSIGRSGVQNPISFIRLVSTFVSVGQHSLVIPIRYGTSAETSDWNSMHEQLEEDHVDSNHRLDPFRFISCAITDLILFVA